jgi:hypothetical protein
MLTIPATSLSDIFGAVSQIFADLFPVFVFAVAIPLVFYVLYRLSKASQGDPEDDFDPDDFEV